MTLSRDLADLASQGVDVGDLAAKADLASPTFTGTPTAPTASAGTNCIGARSNGNGSSGTG